ncbi:hypothetical protein B0T10DRAFT_562079 [Thelonectria olida]|uniref:Uncharacterized protein n=1 Tax=Thelonectria olida TaxID=1576542 RepID=A0A9P8W6A9_9HYPO|nr:hypothetical protein B0T10DRAFT_562079 [Thelonectria olida]
MNATIKEKSTLIAWGSTPRNVSAYPLKLLWGLAGSDGCFNTKAATWIFLVSVFVWGAIYQCTLGAVGFAFGAEVPSLPMRAPTVSFMGFSQMAGVWVVSLVIPYLINPDAANLGPKVGFIFFGVDYLFTSGVSCRRFPEAVAQYRLDNGGNTLKAGIQDDKEPVAREVEKV